ncbi:MAG: type 2 isopentenyl-diphosphate Delta-isomerase [Thermoprotei archaeon]|nr:MAG: type 2 isopentenyl-diphosphate Delta-isomerase [Thermoprotei archaeon]
MEDDIRTRKLEHIDIVVNKDAVYRDACKEVYDSIKLIHQGFPGIDYSEVDPSIEFLGYRLQAPLMITGMTGGHPSTKSINEKLARIASKFNIAIGVGSQRSMLIHKGNIDVIDTYKIVRDIAQEVPVIGNIGINTLRDLNIKDIEYIIESIRADALAIHLNPSQELIQPEGDTRFSHKVLEKIEKIMDSISVPIIIKEVGTGLSIETVQLFYRIGIRYFDVAGACGTNWILVEMYRDGTPSTKKEIAKHLGEWGIPTPISVIETRNTAPNAFIIASGGVWSSDKAVKNLVLGADMVGFARPLIEALIKHGYEYAEKYVKSFIEAIKGIMFLLGARTVYELHHKPVVVLDPVKSYISQRGIDLHLYLEVIRRKP